MQYRPYGTTGYDVSMLGFGAMRLPKRDDGVCDYDVAVPMLRRGIDLGINYIDSARGYINGTSEVAVGKAIKGYDRDKLFIVTKIPSNKPEQSEGASWRSNLEEQLGRFDMPYINLILFHGLRWDAFTEHVSKPGRALDQARKAQNEGLVRHVGFSSHDTPENIQKLIGTGEFDGVLMQYNFLDKRNDPTITKAAEAGMGVTIMGPVAGGRLGVPSSVALDGQSMEQLKIPELALRFVWNHPGVTVALSGMNVTEHIEENVAAAERVAAMSEDEQRQVESLLERNQRLMDLYCTGCGYCMPCPNDVNIPENFRFMTWNKVWGLHEQAKESYGRMSMEGFNTPWGKVVGLKAEACIECGECEPKCPQNIPIIDQLKEVAQALG
jgi:predicted aldo/keto reductase-like oxidoreductase